MAPSGRDAGLEALLDLDGHVFVVDANGQYWVRFVVHRVAPSPARPHGLDYSLSLHGPDGRRLIGFDNAHAVKESRGRRRTGQGPHDHRHRLDRVRPYQFRDAVALVSDFWAEVDRLLEEKGVL